MKLTVSTIYLSLLALTAGMLTSCDDKESNMDLDGSTRIESIRVSGFDGTVDNTAKSTCPPLPT